MWLCMLSSSCVASAGARAGAEASKPEEGGGGGRREELVELRRESDCLKTKMFVREMMLSRAIGVDTILSPSNMLTKYLWKCKREEEH